jgi:outer membrane protein assembly factor BamD (BamD/ComL family)
MIGRGTAGFLLSATLIGAAAVGLSAQANVEDQARRQLESGREFYRNGRYSEALKDFQTVAEGYPTSSVADDALLAIALYQLEIQLDPATARTTADQLIKKYATSDSAPMGYVVMGRATLELDQSPAGLDSAAASFDRVPRLFPASEAVAPALYYGGEVDRRAGRRPQALDRLRDLAYSIPRSIWAARAALLEARLLASTGSQPRRCACCSVGHSRLRVERRGYHAPGLEHHADRLTIRPPAENASATRVAVSPARPASSRRRVDFARARWPPRHRHEGRHSAAGRQGRGDAAGAGDRAEAVQLRSPRLVTIFERSVLMRETDRACSAWC